MDSEQKRDKKRKRREGKRDEKGKRKAWIVSTGRVKMTSSDYQLVT